MFYVSTVIMFVILDSFVKSMADLMKLLAELKMKGGIQDNSKIICLIFQQERML